jgi:tRNA pseudouridine55 synthase
MLGVVNLDKPVGPTSHDMVGLVRRLSGLRRIGHAGTLDPLASGVLPILVGPATRLSQELTGGRKRYDAVIRFGFRSETDDGEGPIAPGGPVPDESAIRVAVGDLVGTFEQRPPAFSARKSGGKVAYQAARGGVALDLAPRAVTIHAAHVIEVISGEGWLDVRVDLETGPGTYVRSVARDLGERLGSGGYLHALRRTEAAGLSAADAHKPDSLEELAANGRFEDAVIPVDRLLILPSLGLDHEQAGRFSHGSEVAWAGDGRVQVHGPAGLIGIGELGDGRLRPRIVLETA